jgi:hypothetical protein
MTYSSPKIRLNVSVTIPVDVSYEQYSKLIPSSPNFSSPTLPVTYQDEIQTNVVLSIPQYVCLLDIKNIGKTFQEIELSVMSRGLAANFASKIEPALTSCILSALNTRLS